MRSRSFFVHSARFWIIAPLGAFVWHTFKNRCPYASASASVRFFCKSCRAYSDRDINFGIYLCKISRCEKSKIQNVFWYLVFVTTSSLFEEKIKNVSRSIYDPKIRNFHNWVHIHSVKTKMFNFLPNENHDPRQIKRQTSSTQEPLKGPPLPCGCNLV